MRRKGIALILTVSLIGILLLTGCFSTKSVGSLGLVAGNASEKASDLVEMPSEIEGKDKIKPLEPVSDEGQNTPSEEPSEQGQPSNVFYTELFDNGNAYMTIPAGWDFKIISWYQKNAYIFEIRDPQNPDYAITIVGGMYAGFPSQSSKDNWIMIMQNPNAGGQFIKGPDFNYGLVLDDATASTLLGRWEEMRAFLSSGDAVEPLRNFTNFTVIGTADPTGGLYENYGQTYGFDIDESIAMATCTGPTGAACKSYMYCATGYMNAGVGYYDTNYYHFSHGYTIMAPEEYMDTYLDVLIQCAESLGFKNMF